MALTNYLLQSIILVPVCYIFDLSGKVTSSIALMLALGTFAFQILFSMAWLRYFNFGPAEWAWRTLTYGKLQSPNGV